MWIGNNATIMSGVKVGDGAIIAAGAIVTMMCLVMQLLPEFLRKL